ncbi:unnamed protein product, partial [Choristocarpus tenellus]
MLRRFAGVDLAVRTGVSQGDLEREAPAAKSLLLKITRPGGVPDVFLTQSNAVLRYIATLRPTSLLYGRTEFESALVDQWLETCWHEFEVPVEAIALAAGNSAVITESKHHLLAFLAIANTRLAQKTYLGAERITIADISLATVAEPLLKGASGAAAAASTGGVRLLSSKDIEGLAHVM